MNHSISSDTSDHCSYSYPTGFNLFFDEFNFFDGLDYIFCSFDVMIVFYG